MLGEMSPMLSSLVTAQFADARSIEFVTAQPGPSWAEAVERNAADVLLTRAGSVAECEALLVDLARAAPIGVVAISRSGRSGTAYRLDSRPVPASAEGRLDLLGAIAVAAGQSAREYR